MSLIYQCDRCGKQVPAVYELKWNRLNPHPMSQYEEIGRGDLCYDCEEQLVEFVHGKPVGSARD
jgi:DNA-directed RNA polymerase subunit RPC12/RpoP